MSIVPPPGLPESTSRVANLSLPVVSTIYPGLTIPPFFLGLSFVILRLLCILKAGWYME